MDSRTVDSEDCDILEFLSLPVKRIPELNSKNLPLEIVNFKSDFYEGFSNNNKPAIDTPGHLSATQVSTHYPFDHHKDIVANFNHIPLITGIQPTIRVTVIPRTEQTQNKKQPRKRLRIPPKVQGTASHERNFFQNQAVYCAAADRKKESVHEVRTTESANFRHSQSHFERDEETHITRVTNIKRLICSLNMEKNKRKGKTEVNKRTAEAHNSRKYEIVNERVCIDDVMTQASSRVRIYGELGLNGDDEYVLKYGATVNNKPVMADVTKVLDKNKPDFTKHKNERHRDSTLEADYPVKVDFITGKGTQGTQVNFNINLPNASELAPETVTKMVDKIIQCNCKYTANYVTNNFQGDEILEQQSPLLIISVYPKPQTVEQIRPEKIPTESTRQREQGVKQPLKTNLPRRQIGNSQMKRTPALDKTTDKPIGRSRSPSPSPRDTRKNFTDKPKVNTVTRENKRPISPLKVLQARIQEKDNVRRTTNLQTQRTSPPVSLDPKRQIIKSKSLKSKAKEIGVNTDHLETKKTLVENFTKSVSSTLHPKQRTHENDTSKVTINIDGEKEYYDVLLNQNKRTTGVSIRKTMKDLGSQKSAGCRYQGSDSLENFICMSNGNQKDGSLSMSFKNNPSKESICAHVSRLTIRDSLEICHRRDKQCQSIKNIQTSTRSVCEKTANNFLAPIKHYTGDDCCILNPVVRDREIRQLLGVDSMRPNTTAQQKVVHPMVDNFSYNCLYGNCSKNYVNNMNILPSKNSSAHLFSRPVSHSKANNDVMASVCKQLVLNRNVQVFLQVEQFTKQKPIILTKKQYERVRRTIQKTISKNSSYHKRKYLRRSDVSVGEVKIKAKTDVNVDCDKQVQTIWTRNVQNINNYEKVKSQKDTEPGILKNEGHETTKRKVTTMVDQAVDCTELFIDKRTELEDAITKSIRNSDESFDTNTYIRKRHIFDYNHEGGNRSSRKTMSSVEVHYANVAYEKCVKFSSREKSLPKTRLERKASFMTLFRGQRKPPTPNLGTSEFSLDTEETDDESIKVLMKPREPQPRRPLLKRLMSCLVMRSTRDSDPKLVKTPKTKLKAAESSVDSYFISSSLAAVEVSSSIYDTSASFYSNHTIYPVNSKMKRGFFSSVRGFLSNKRS